MTYTVNTSRGPVRFHAVGEPIVGIPACPSVLSWPTYADNVFTCRHCGRAFQRHELQGRDDHVPPHAPLTPHCAAVLSAGPL